MKGVNDIDNKNVPLWEKANLTIEEASKYFGIGQNKLRELTKDAHCPYVIWCGKKRLIKRKLFAEYIEKMYSI
ncbi:MAG: excisionase family DNA-binding protein [Ruminococcus sp.]|nr:excisionase family DNA-binding protein [Ruminococcus sp.]